MIILSPKLISVTSFGNGIIFKKEITEMQFTTISNVSKNINLNLNEKENFDFILQPLYIVIIIKSKFKFRKNFILLPARTVRPVLRLRLCR